MIGDLSIPLVVANYVIFVFALTVHEAAHAWMAKQGGDTFAESEGRLTLNPLPHLDPIGTVLLPILGAIQSFPVLCWAKPVPVKEHNLRHSSYMMWTALAGPASNLILAAWGICVYRLLVWIEPTLQPRLNLLFFFIAVNVMLMVFNLIPIPPLDGGTVAYYTIFRARPALASVWEAIERYGFFVLLLCIFIRPLRDVTLSPLIGYFLEQVLALIWL